MRPVFKSFFMGILILLVMVLSACSKGESQADIVSNYNRQVSVSLSFDSLEVGTVVSSEFLLAQIVVDDLYQDTTVSLNYDANRWGLSSTQEIILDKLGTYELVIDLDHELATVNRVVYFSVVDTTPPIISGEFEYSITEGESIDYKAGITAVDNFDSEVTVSYSDADFNKNSAGDYTIIVTATDSSGNRSEESISITVNPKPIETPVVTQTSPAYTGSESLNEILDSIISEIITDGMSDSQKVSAVYKWMQNNLTYRGGAANSETIETNAYYIATNRRGQCQHWAAFSYAIINRLGIETIYVNGLGRNYDQPKVYHAWIRVIINGQSLHFDPLYGTRFNGVQFDQVTSEFCYSKRSHKWDTSVYGE